MIDDLRKAAGEASEGPWWFFGSGDVVSLPLDIAACPYRAIGQTESEGWKHNARYIALCSPDNILKLLDENAALREWQAAVMSGYEVYQELGATTLTASDVANVLDATARVARAALAAIEKGE